MERGGLSRNSGSGWRWSCGVHLQAAPSSRLPPASARLLLLLLPPCLSPPVPGPLQSPRVHIPAPCRSLPEARCVWTLQSAPKQRSHHTKLTVKLKSPASPPILFLLGASFLKQEKRNPPKNLGKACSGMPSEAKSAVGLICTSITESI